MFKHSQDIHKKYNDHNSSHYISLVALIGLVFGIVGGISYAAYLFIDATHISNAAGVHLTKNLSLAVKELKGNLYSDNSRGIKDWIIYIDNLNGYAIKYPNDWEVQKRSNSFLLLKKYVSSSSKNSSLATTVEIGNIFLEEGEILKDAAIKKGIEWNANWKEELLNGRMGLRTGKIKTAEGLMRDVIFWENKQDRKVFYLEATYFTDKSTEFENIFKNVISEFKFI